MGPDCQNTARNNGSLLQGVRMPNPEIDLLAIAHQQTEAAFDGANPQDDRQDNHLEPWIEDYAASGTVKGGCPV